MRKSREAAAETREKIIQVAARLFRERGVEAVGVAELMREAGLTHGGFYKHFPSKEALVAEACRTTLSDGRRTLVEAGDQRAAGGLQQVLSRYLSTAHRDYPGSGCAIAALAGELSRHDGAPRQAISDGARHLVRMVAGLMREEGLQADEAEARAVVAAMIGGLLLSRAVDDPEESGAVLKDTRQFLLKALGKR